MDHVPVQAIRHRAAFGCRLDHALVDQPQLVHTPDHHVGLHALPHVEGMLGQFHAGGAYHVGAEDQRVHENVFGKAEMPQIVPGQALTRLHGVAEVHHMLVAFLDLVVHVVGHQHVDGVVARDLLTQGGEHVLQRFRSYPVVGVHDLHILAGRRLDTGVHRAAMPLVLLMNGTHDAWIVAFELLRVGEGAVFGTVVDDQDLKIVGSVRGKQRVHAPVEICLHIV